MDHLLLYSLFKVPSPSAFHPTPPHPSTLLPLSFLCKEGPLLCDGICNLDWYVALAQRAIIFCAQHHDNALTVPYKLILNFENLFIDYTWKSREYIEGDLCSFWHVMLYMGVVIAKDAFSNAFWWINQELTLSEHKKGKLQNHFRFFSNKNW